ncbi:MAG: ROK family glucokinase [Lachnospiraceae bacterium]|nr:ROK family glucokinase [Lachnospiraceae bacterium]MDE6128390.1 ROK family glucokinase [Lachnospiraceae bacterium]
MKKYVFGIDVGGTTIKMGLFDMNANVLEKWEIKSVTANGGERILPDIAESIQNKMKEMDIETDEVAGIGIGVPGPVDAEGTVYKTANLGWDTVFHIPEAFQEYLKLPVMAGNDANVAALGEMWQGGGKGYKDLVVVTLGTGVGGGIICNGQMVTGANGAGGEIGHIHVEDNETEECGCHNIGCLEQYASATGIARLARKRLEEDTEDSILRGREISAKAVFDAVKFGDKVAIQIAERFGEYLGKGLAAIAGVVNPEIFVIGGGVSKAGEVLFEYIRPYYMQYAFRGCRDAKFALATLGNDAGIFGAAKLVLDNV